MVFARAMTKPAKLAGSLSWPGCGTSVQLSVRFPPLDRAKRIFKSSSRIAFRSGKAKTRNSCKIVLCFSGRAAQLVRERNWHPSQRIQESTDGTLELRMTLNSLEEIVPWILSWGKECRVLSPPKLQRKVESLAMTPKPKRSGNRSSDSSVDDQYLL